MLRTSKKVGMEELLEVVTWGDKAPMETHYGGLARNWFYWSRQACQITKMNIYLKGHCFHLYHDNYWTILLPIFLIKNEQILIQPEQTLFHNVHYLFDQEHVSEDDLWVTNEQANCSYNNKKKKCCNNKNNSHKEFNSNTSTEWRYRREEEVCCLNNGILPLVDESKIL